MQNLAELAQFQKGRDIYGERSPAIWQSILKREYGALRLSSSADCEAEKGGLQGSIDLGQPTACMSVLYTAIVFFLLLMHFNMHLFVHQIAELFCILHLFVLHSKNCISISIFVRMLCNQQNMMIDIFV